MQRLVILFLESSAPSAPHLPLRPLSNVGNFGANAGEGAVLVVLPERFGLPPPQGELTLSRRRRGGRNPGLCSIKNSFGFGRMREMNMGALSTVVFQAVNSPSHRLLLTATIHDLNPVPYLGLADARMKGPDPRYIPV